MNAEHDVRVARLAHLIGELHRLPRHHARPRLALPLESLERGAQARVVCRAQAARGRLAGDVDDFRDRD